MQIHQHVKKIIDKMSEFLTINLNHQNTTTHTLPFYGLCKIRQYYSDIVALHLGSQKSNIFILPDLQ